MLLLSHLAHELRLLVRRCPLPSAVGGGDCYSLGYSAVPTVLDRMPTSMPAVGTAITVCSGTEPGDELDLDGDADRQLGQADRCAGRRAEGVARSFTQRANLHTSRSEANRERSEAANCWMKETGGRFLA